MSGRRSGEGILGRGSPLPRTVGGFRLAGGACAEQPRSPFISAEAALGRAERRAQGWTRRRGLSPASVLCAGRPPRDALELGARWGRSWGGGYGEGETLWESHTAQDWGGGAGIREKPLAWGGGSEGEGSLELGRERKLAEGLRMSGGFGFGGRVV